MSEPEPYLSVKDRIALAKQRDEANRDKLSNISAKGYNDTIPKNIPIQPQSQISSQIEIPKNQLNQDQVQIINSVHLNEAEPYMSVRDRIALAKQRDEATKAESSNSTPKFKRVIIEKPSDELIQPIIPQQASTIIKDNPTTASEIPKTSDQNQILRQIPAKISTVSPQSKEFQRTSDQNSDSNSRNLEETKNNVKSLQARLGNMNFKRPPVHDAPKIIPQIPNEIINSNQNSDLIALQKPIRKRNYVPSSDFEF